MIHGPFRHLAHAFTLLNLFALFPFLSLSLSLMMSFPFVWEGQKWCHHLKQEPEARMEASPLARWTSLYVSWWMALLGDPLLSRAMEDRQKCEERKPTCLFQLILNSFYPLFTLMVPLLIPSLSFSLKQAVSSLSISFSPSVTLSSRCLCAWLRGQSSSNHWLH